MVEVCYLHAKYKELLNKQLYIFGALQTAQGWSCLPIHIETMS